jgi:hypothetical protein
MKLDIIYMYIQYTSSCKMKRNQEPSMYVQYTDKSGIQRTIQLYKRDTRIRSIVDASRVLYMIYCSSESVL